jgi:hypothetical protein
MTATLNGKPHRKQLGDQLDRLDGMIDLLAEALPQAVADACREGSKAAMKEALLELLTNPEVRALLPALAPPPAAAATLPPAEGTPGVWATVKAKLAEAKAAVAARARAAVAATAAAARVLDRVVPVRRIALVAGGVGVAVGLLALVCPPLLAAAVTAVGGACAAAAAQVTGGLRRAGVLAPATE